MAKSPNSMSFEEAEELVAKAKQVGRNKPWKKQSDLALSMDLTIVQLKGRLKSARHIIKMQRDETDHQHYTIPGLEKMQNHEEMSAKDIISYAHKNWKKKKEKDDLLELVPVKFSKDVVTGICVWGDPHLDDGGANWDVLTSLIKT